jgi:penicillin-binding protein 1A
MLANILSGGFAQGGSTINQQVIKNALLTKDKKISRKLKEITPLYKTRQGAAKRHDSSNLP